MDPWLDDVPGRERHKNEAEEQVLIFFFRGHPTCGWNLT